MAFALNISTDNAAFGEDGDDMAKAGEVARILMALAGQIDDSTGHLPAGGDVRDYNGNSVGRWTLTHD